MFSYVAFKSVRVYLFRARRISAQRQNGAGWPLVGRAPGTVMCVHTREQCRVRGPGMRFAQRGCAPCGAASCSNVVLPGHGT